MVTINYAMQEMGGVIPLQQEALNDRKKLWDCNIYAMHLCGTKDDHVISDINDAVSGIPCINSGPSQK